MRGRKKQWLRLGGVAILGCCLGGVGCQSSRPLVSLQDGSSTQIVGIPAGAVSESGETQVVLETASPVRVVTAEPTSGRSVLARLMRPTANRGDSSPPQSAPNRVVAQAVPGVGSVPATGVASSWAPLQREGQAMPPSVATARWQPQGPEGASNRQPPLPLPKDVTPPPTLDPTSKPKASPEPGLLHQPRPMPTETGPDMGDAPFVEHGVPSVGHHAPSEAGKISLPTYIIDPPDILLVETIAAPKEIQEIKGQHLVRPDGTIGLGVYGPVYVAGMTLDQARAAVAQAISNRLEPSKLAELRSKGAEPRAANINVDVIAYNSKVYYVITDGGGFGEQVRRFPVTGSETVLDAISNIDGLPAVASKKKIWIARRTTGHQGPPQILPVHWVAITQGGQATANYQVMPGDRIYVHSQGIIRADSMIGKVLAPIERLLGTTLLGSSTVNSIQGRGAGFGGTGVR